MALKCFKSDRIAVARCAMLYSPAIVTALLTIIYATGIADNSILTTCAFLSLTVGFVVSMTESKRRWKSVGEKIERNRQENARKESSGDQSL